jgi:hypothetical protein
MTAKADRYRGAEDPSHDERKNANKECHLVPTQPRNGNRSAVCIYLESEERIYDSAEIVSIHILVVAKRDPRASVVCAVDAADPCNDRHM